MSLVRNFKASTSLPNQIELNWTQPLGFNTVDSAIIVTRTTSHYPVELYNPDFPTKATDNRPVEIFNGSTIVGIVPGNISVVGTTLTDTGANFPTFPYLTGRLLRDSLGNTLRILSNTTTTVTLESAPANGKYVILAEFPTTIRAQQNFESDIRTITGNGYITNLVELVNGSLQVAAFETDELANSIFKDANGDKFVVKNNTTNTIYFYETTTPVAGTGSALLTNFLSGQTKPFIDNYKIEDEVFSGEGTGLLDNQFYYYTSFSKLYGTNVAQAEFASIDSGISTQSVAISIKDRDWAQILYNYWPSLYRQLDATGDLEDLMKVFAFQFGELHSLISTFKLQDTDNVFSNALVALSEQTGLPAVGYSIGADTLRRIAADLISAWHLKGSKEGIALFIRILTTWDVTGGTADFSSSIIDFLPNVTALRFFDANLGSTNVRITKTDPFVSGGRFAKTLPGIVIPGFFTFREFVVTIPNVALYVGNNSSYSISSGTTTMIDASANFGAVDSLIGNFLLPNQEEVNDVFQIVGNTATSITVKGIINNRNVGGKYAVLSPLNINRFTILNKLLPVYIPYGTICGFIFT